MKKSLIYVLILFLCSSFIFKNIESVDGTGMIPVYASSNYIVFSHKKQKKIGDSWLCNVRIYHLKNRVTFEDRDQGNLKLNIFLDSLNKSERS